MRVACADAIAMAHRVPRALRRGDLAKAAMNETYILTLSCRDHPGIVAGVSTFLADHGCNIREAQQFDDVTTGRFFMRVEFEFVATDGIDDVRAGFVAVAEAHGLDYRIRAASGRKRVLLLASKFDHCLADLLYRWRTGELAMEPVGIVSNHPRETYAHLDFNGIPFHHLPVTPETNKLAGYGKPVPDSGIEIEPL